MTRERGDLAFAVWHTAALSRPDKVPAKKFPKIKDLLPQVKAAPRRRQTWQEQLAITAAW